MFSIKWSSLILTLVLWKLIHCPTTVERAIEPNSRPDPTDLNALRIQSIHTGLWRGRNMRLPYDVWHDPSRPNELWEWFYFEQKFEPFEAFCFFRIAQGELDLESESKAACLWIVQRTSQYRVCRPSEEKSGVCSIRIWTFSPSEKFDFSVLLSNCLSEAELLLSVRTILYFQPDQERSLYQKHCVVRHTWVVFCAFSLTVVFIFCLRNFQRWSCFQKLFLETWSDVPGTHVWTVKWRENSRGQISLSSGNRQQAFWSSLVLFLFVVVRSRQFYCASCLSVALCSWNVIRHTPWSVFSCDWNSTFQAVSVRRPFDEVAERLVTKNGVHHKGYHCHWRSLKKMKGKFSMIAAIYLVGWICYTQTSKRKLKISTQNNAKHKDVLFCQQSKRALAGRAAATEDCRYKWEVSQRVFFSHWKERCPQFLVSCVRNKNTWQVRDAFWHEIWSFYVRSAGQKLAVRS